MSDSATTLLQIPLFTIQIKETGMSLEPNDNNLRIKYKWLEILLGGLSGPILFSLLTLLFFNSWAASLFPSEKSFPSGVRLLLGWSIASLSSYSFWRLLARRHLMDLGKGWICSCAVSAVIWLTVIAVACMYAYA